jgi:hypothetical protein
MLPHRGRTAPEHARGPGRRCVRGLSRGPAQSIIGEWLVGTPWRATIRR